jgi:hypothetical protein
VRDRLRRAARVVQEYRGVLVRHLRRMMILAQISRPPIKATAPEVPPLRFN